MHFSPADTEKLLLATAGMVARDRLQRGVKLNYPESVALLSIWIIEAARDGRTVEDLMEAGTSVLRADQVMKGVPELLTEVQVEATFPDGRKLVTLHHPIGTGSDTGMRVQPGTIELNADRTDDERLSLVIENTGDRPVQVGSHFHLPDTNPALSFDREAAQGFRLDIASGTSVRFEPGVSRTVQAVRLRGRSIVAGLSLDDDTSHEESH